MWKQISNMIENGKTYTEIATFVAKTRYVTKDIYDESHFEYEIPNHMIWDDDISTVYRDSVWDDILDVCCDIMEEMKIDTWSDYSHDVIECCRKVFTEQSYTNKLINDVIIETISSFIKFLEDKSIGDWHDNLICDYDDDDNDDDNNVD